MSSRASYGILFTIAFGTQCKHSDKLESYFCQPMYDPLSLVCILYESLYMCLVHISGRVEPTEKTRERHL